MQEIVPLKSIKKLLSLGVDILRVAKHAAVLRSADRAYFSSPVVDILKEVSVNGFVMVEVEIAGGEFFIGSGVAHFSLESGKIFSV